MSKTRNHSFVKPPISAVFRHGFDLLWHPKAPVSEQIWIIYITWARFQCYIPFSEVSGLQWPYIYWKNCDFEFFYHISALSWPVFDLYGTKGIKGQFQSKYGLSTLLELDFVDWCYVSLQVGTRITQTTKLYWVNQLGPLMPKGWKSTPC